MKFSVVTVCYNAAATIGDTLDSVARQTFTDYEHVIIDGASADDSLNEIDAHSHDRIKVFSEPDRGPYDAMNKGLRLAVGDYVIFLNADDFFSRSDALALVAERIAVTGAACIFADTELVKPDGVTPTARLYSAARFQRWWLRAGIMPPHPSMFVRRDLLLKLGGFDTSYRIGADFDLIARAILRERASWSSLPVAITRFRVGGLSTRGLRSKLIVGRESGRSLRALGQPLASMAVLLRFPLKAFGQFRPLQRLLRRVSAR